MKIVALFSYRYDKGLLSELLQNLEEIVDDYIAYDDSNNKDLFFNESETRARLIAQAKERKFDYALIIDPDERLEVKAGKEIRKLIDKYDRQKVIFTFNLREMWTNSAYRIDGIWGKKQVSTMFPLIDGQEFSSLKAHNPRHPVNQDYFHIDAGLNLYHLKMITPEAREARKKLYKSLDPDRQIQTIGYDYLTDETDIVLEEIPDKRKFFPPHDPSFKMVTAVSPLYKDYIEKKKILLTNHHLFDYAGSELVTLDLAIYFKNKGWDVYVATFMYGGNMQKLFEKNNISVFNVINDALQTKEFDLVWGHHFPVLIKCLIEDKVRTRSLILSSLSPYEPLESLPLFYKEADLILCNSEETKRELVERQIYNADKLFLFKNSVSSTFFSSFSKSKKVNNENFSRMKSVAIISNHPPQEIFDAIIILKSQLINVDLVGLGNGNPKPVNINLLANYDAVITIGRTVQHCMALEIPVFVYDHFGGPGWLSPDNFKLAEWFNYSGRCCHEKLTATEIAVNIASGFLAAKKHTTFFKNYAEINYCLEKNIDEAIKNVSHILEGKDKDYIIFSPEQRVFNKSSQAYRRILSQSIHIQSELERSQSELERSHSELERSQSELERSQSELERSQSELERSQSELERSQSDILAMKSSKFWKLRLLWFKIKCKFRST